MFSFFFWKILRSRFIAYHWLYGINIDKSVCVQYNIVSMCCVGRKSHNIFFPHLLYPEKSVCIIICALFFLYLFLCVFLSCFCFDIYSRPWLRTKFDWCLCIQSQLLLIIKEWFLMRPWYMRTKIWLIDIHPSNSF